MHQLQIVAQRFALLVFLTLVVLGLGLSHGRASAADAEQTGVWTIVIPEGFPDYVYTWRLKGDGTYEEDGRNAQTGEAIQTTLTGMWSVKGARMTLRQDRLSYVFDGMISGGHYTGMLTLGGGEVSHFCAAKGTAAPARCDTKDVTAMLEKPRGSF